MVGWAQVRLVWVFLPEGGGLMGWGGKQLQLQKLAQIRLTLLIHFDSMPFLDIVVGFTRYKERL